MGRRKASEPQVLTVEEGIDSLLDSVVENVFNNPFFTVVYLLFTISIFSF